MQQRICPYRSEPQHGALRRQQSGGFPNGDEPSPWGAPALLAARISPIVPRSQDTRKRRERPPPEQGGRRVSPSPFGKPRIAAQSAMLGLAAVGADPLLHSPQESSRSRPRELLLLRPDLSQAALQSGNVQLYADTAFGGVEDHPYHAVDGAPPAIWSISSSTRSAGAPCQKHSLQPSGSSCNN